MDKCSSTSYLKTKKLAILPMEIPYYTCLDGYNTHPGIPNGTPEKMAAAFWTRLEHMYSADTASRVKNLLAFHPGDFLTHHPAGLDTYSLTWTPALLEAYAPWVSLLFWETMKGEGAMDALTSLASILQPSPNVFDCLPEACYSIPVGELRAFIEIFAVHNILQVCNTYHDYTSSPPKEPITLLLSYFAVEQYIQGNLTYWEKWTAYMEVLGACGDVPWCELQLEGS